MKIAGVVSNYKDAKEIEDIVRTLVIRERISVIISNRKKFINNAIDKRKITSKDDNKIIENIKINISEKEMNNTHLPIFNFRGLS